MENKIPYHKIDTLFERGKNFNVDTDKLRRPVIATISKWQVTEKVDGKNIRIMFDGNEVLISGRSDDAQINGDLLNILLKMFPVEKLKEICDPDTEYTFYGEGYGAGIQKCGSKYRPDKSFRLFDVLVDGRWWLDWDAVSGIASKLGIKTVPYYGEMSLDKIVELVKTGFSSDVALQDSGTELDAEGIVARPLETLFDKRGYRLIIKLKTIDFTHPVSGQQEGGETNVE